jgi:flotillin
MNPHYVIIIAIAGIILVTFIFAAIWASHFVKVGVKQVLIVSGRQHMLPDGTHRGFRIVRNGGTFVLPVIEKAQVLSLEVLSIEIPKWKGRTAKRVPLEADCLAQIKIKGDDASILAAAEYFLSKNEGEMKSIVRPVMEKHLRTILDSLNSEEIGQIEACAARVQAATSVDLGKMGLDIISFTIGHVRIG